MEIGFEELEAKPLESLEYIYDTLGLGKFELARPAITAYLASVKNYKKNTYTSLPSKTQEKLVLR